MTPLPGLSFELDETIEMLRDTVRGFGRVKERNDRLAAQKQAWLLSEFTGAGAADAPAVRAA